MKLEEQFVGFPHGLTGLAMHITQTSPHTLHGASHIHSIMELLTYIWSYQWGQIWKKTAR